MYPKRLPGWIPQWVHPRFPLVANELRKRLPVGYATARTTGRVSRLLVILVYPALALSLILLIFGGARIFGLMLYVPTIVISVIIILTVEWLYFRLWINVPLFAAQMVTHEVRDHTWDIIRSLPVPRYQIVMSKLAAVWWLVNSSMLYVIMSRLLMVGMIIALYFSLTGASFSEQNELRATLLGLGIALIPLAEFFLLAVIGLTISALVTVDWVSTAVSLSTSLIYRLLTTLMFNTFFLQGDVRDPVLLFPLVLFPHWTLLFFWLLVVRSSLDTTPAVFSAGVGTIYLFFPLTVGIVLLFFTIRRVQHH
jgi:hypothetical protein